MSAPGLAVWPWRRTTPLIVQSEAAECGLACLAMVAARHGSREGLAGLRQRHAVSAKGATLQQLVHIAGRMQLSARALKVELEHLGALQLPAILHWEFTHFVVLEALRGGRAVVLDPAQGRRVIPLAKLSRHFTGVALELAPLPEFAPRRPPPGVRLADLVGPLPGLWPVLVQLFALAVVLEGAAMAAPLFTQLVVDQVLLTADHELLMVLALGFGLLALFQAAVAGLRSWSVMTLGARMNLQWTGRLLGRLLRLPMSFFERRHLGDVVSRFDSLNAIQRTLTTSFVEAILDGIMAVATLAMMLAYGGWMTAIVAAAASAYAAMRLLLYAPLRAATEEQIACASRQQTHFLESVRGLQAIKLFNRQGQRASAYQNLLVGHINADMRAQSMQILYRALNAVVFAAENVTVIWAGASAVLGSQLSVGMLLAFIAYKQQFVARTTALVEKGLELRMLDLHLQRIGEIASVPAEGATAASSPDLQPRDASVELRGVGLRYGEFDPPVLQQLDLTVAAGESVALVGASGCGKSTLARVIAGLLQPTAGAVLIGGIDLRCADPDVGRSWVGCVMQDDQVFAGSLSENISFFDEHADATRVEACARLAAIHDDIIAMPMGYHTLVGDMGMALSGGQKQRLLLARALYKEPRILVLDEATSHLDVRTERLVNDAVRRLALTRIIIAHRPETIASADRVVLIEDGRATSLPTELRVRHLHPADANAAPAEPMPARPPPHAITAQWASGGIDTST